MKSFASVIACLLAASFAFACSSRSEVQPDEREPVATQGNEEPVEPVEEAPADPDDVHLEGEYITIDQHIRFGFDSDEILAESTEILDHLAAFLSNHQTEAPSLEVIGHTDAQGGRRHNQELSERRAAAVVSALQERGVTQELQAIGRGQAERLCTEDTDECHEQNRRVVFHVVR